MKRNPLKIWNTTFESNTVNVKGIDFATDRKRLDIMDEFRDHVVIDPATAPDYVHFKYRDTPEKKKSNLPDLMMIVGGLFMVSEGFRDLLQGFEIGSTQFFEVPLYEYDQTTRRPGRWFLFNITEIKDALVPEACENIEEMASSGIYRSSMADKDVIAVRPDAAEGVDLWYDRCLRSRFFLTDRLKEAIRASDLRVRAMPFRRCKIVESPS